MEAQRNSPDCRSGRIQQQHSPRLPEPLVQLNEKASLFAASQRPTAMPSQVMPTADPGRPSLFNAVTGRSGGGRCRPAGRRLSRNRCGGSLRWRNTSRKVPRCQCSRQADQTGLEIPAFLRRQHSCI